MFQITWHDPEPQDSVGRNARGERNREREKEKEKERVEALVNSQTWLIETGSARIPDVQPPLVTLPSFNLRRHSLLFPRTNACKCIECAPPRRRSRNSTLLFDIPGGHTCVMVCLFRGSRGGYSSDLQTWTWSIEIGCGNPDRLSTDF